MEEKIKSLAHDHHAHIMYGDLDAPGHVIFPPQLNGEALICVDSKLSEHQQTNVILHELGHVAMQRDDRVLYDATVNMKLKMERDANRYMLRHLLDNYMNTTGSSPASFNYVDFMKRNNIPSCDENIVREMIAEY